VHTVRDEAFADGSVLATISNRRLRASRTYLYRPHAPGWSRELEQDLRSGVFGAARQPVEVDQRSIPMDAMPAFARGGDRYGASTARGVGLV